MKKYPLIVSLLLTAACACAPDASAQNKSSAAEQTELGLRMEDINASWRRLRRQVSDPTQNAASLALIAKIREAAKGTEQMAPAKTVDIPEAKRAKFQADYAAGMEKFFGQIDALEAALKGSDNAAAAKVVAAVNDYQKEAHKEFRKETDKK
jgi:soluble cytochrome b562